MCAFVSVGRCTTTATTFVGGVRNTRLQTVAATHVNPKATKHHRKTRPKKSNPSDKNRKPRQRPELPQPPPQVVVISEAKKEE